MPVYYQINGCVYINKIEELNSETSFNDNRIPFIMPKEYAVDIDEAVDLAVAEYYIASHLNSKKEKVKKERKLGL